MTVYCIGVLEPLPAERVIQVTSADTAHMGLTDGGTLPTCPGFIELWDDDFADGDALAVHYGDILDCETANGAGQAGGWGVQTTGDASAQYYGGFTYTLAADETGQCGAVQLDVDLSHSDDNDDGTALFEIRDSNMGGGVRVIALYAGIGAARGDIELYSDYDGDPPHLVGTQAGALTADSWQTVRMEWRWSTNSVTNDGWIRVLVNTVEVLRVDNIVVSNWEMATNGTNAWNRVWFGPIGHGDNLLIYGT